jgi:asparagine synthase (glutamine-hydrolysing)
MSGICGIFSVHQTSLVSHDILRPMMDAIGHRGRAARRSFVDEAAGIAIGHVFAPTFQGSPEDATPNWHEDAGHVVTFDGSIFNATELIPGDRAHLYPHRACGAVVEHLRQSPSAFPERLDGHFGLAVWDKTQRELWLVRDAPGAKPLYYHHVPGSGLVVFASELKGLFAHPAISRQVNRDGLTAYLTFGYLPAPLSIIDGIHKVYAGEVLKFDSRRQLTARRYWDIPRFQPQDASLEEMAEQTREHVIQTVAKHARGAQRVGVFLSGGVDSTVVLGILKLLGVPDIHTFTLGFQHDASKTQLTEDLYWAELTARTFGSQHHPLAVPVHHDPNAALPDILRMFDDPMLTPNCYAKSLLADMAVSAGVDSCMSGSCAGPCFQQRTPKKIRKVLEAIAPDASREEMVLEDRMALFSFKEQTRLLAAPHPDPRLVTLGVIQRFAEDVRADGIGDYVNGTLLRMQAEKSLGVQDRAAILKGVELRHPFHDAKLIRFANTIPASYKGSQSEEMNKKVLTAAFKDMLPEEIITRKKTGFPSYYWTNGEVDALKARLLSPEGVERVGLFRPDAVRTILEEDAMSTKKSAGKKTWGLLVIHAWFELHINRNDAFFAEYVA